MLKNTVTLITGAAGGLGRATVDKFVQKGSRVILCDLPTSKGNSVAKSYGENAIFMPADVTEEKDITAALEAAETTFGRLDFCVNCAGVSSAYETYNFNKKTPAKLEDFERMIKVNTVGTFNVIRLAAGLISKNEPNGDGQRGVIINTSSVTAYDGTNGQAGQAASNAAIIGMTLPIAREFKDVGIRVVTIAPGLFNTPLLLGTMPAETKQFLAETVVFPQRFGKPEEYAEMVQIVIETPMLNGTTIRLDGGYRGFLL